MSDSLTSIQQELAHYLNILLKAHDDGDAVFLDPYGVDDRFLAKAREALDRN